VSSLAHGPSEILGLETGCLSVGAPADICIVKAKETWQIDEKNWLSRGMNTPYLGHQMKGRVTYTLVNGRLVFGK